jgi:glycosyltransferase involved in cell wall biosynthesis
LHNIESNSLKEKVLINRHILVPCKDEAGNIPSLVDDFLQHFEIGDCLWLVEGGSKDNTAEVCMQYSRENISINFLSQIGRGKFGGVKTALNHLMEIRESGLIAIWDADHSIKFSDVRRAFGVAESNTCFVFTERLGAKIERGAMPKINNLGNRVIAFIASMVFKTRIKDALSGTKVFNLSLFEKLDRKDIHGFLANDTYGDLSYFLLAKMKDVPMYNVNVDYYARKYGVSSLNRLSNGIELLRSLRFARDILKRKQSE